MHDHEQQSWQLLTDNMLFVFLTKSIQQHAKTFSMDLLSTPDRFRCFKANLNSDFPESIADNHNRPYDRCNLDNNSLNNSAYMKKIAPLFDNYEGFVFPEDAITDFSKVTDTKNQGKLRENMYGPIRKEALTRGRINDMILFFINAQEHLKEHVKNEKLSKTQLNTALAEINQIADAFREKLTATVSTIDEINATLKSSSEKVYKDCTEEHKKKKNAFKRPIWRRALTTLLALVRQVLILPWLVDLIREEGALRWEAAFHGYSNVYHYRMNKIGKHFKNASFESELGRVKLNNDLIKTGQDFQKELEEMIESLSKVKHQIDPTTEQTVPNLTQSPETSLKQATQHESQPSTSPEPSTSEVKKPPTTMI